MGRMILSFEEYDRNVSFVMDFTVPLLCKSCLQRSIFQHLEWQSSTKIFESRCSCAILKQIIKQLPQQIINQTIICLYFEMKLLRRLGNCQFSQAIDKISWRQTGRFVEFTIYNDQLDSECILPVNRQMKLSQLMSSGVFQAESYNLEVNDKEQTLKKFIDYPQPEKIIFISKGKQNCIQNKSCCEETKFIKQFMEKENTLFYYLNTHRNHVHPVLENDASLTQHDYIIRFYLRLQSEGYYRMLGINSSDDLTDLKRRNIIEHLIRTNSGDSMRSLKLIDRKTLKAMAELQKAKSNLQEIDELGEKALKWYQKGLIGLTAFHIVSFGYMIFGVQWLGWDIIEPLTFSVFCLYFLISVRFFRKHNIDRSNETIRSTIMHQILSAKDKLKHSELKASLRVRQQDLKLVEQERQLILNRLKFKTTVNYHDLAP